MRIGIDIDEVIVEFMKSFLEFYNKIFSTDFKIPNIFNYYLKEPLKIPGEKIRELVNKFYLTEDFLNLKIINGSIESIRNLSMKNEIFFITSRPEIIKEKTISFLKSNFDFPFEVYFSGEMWGGKTKEQICKEIGINLLIDDNPDFSLICAQKGINVFLFGNYPWNQNGTLHPNIKRVKNWGDILKELK